MAEATADADAGQAWPRRVSALAAEVQRVARRLRELSAPRLRQPLPPYGTVADAGHQLAQALATAELGVVERAATAPQAPRTVPRLRDEVVGDQVAVTGNDLLAAVACVGAETMVWHVDQRVQASAVVAGTYALVHTVKLAID